MPFQHGGAGWTLSGFVASVLLLLAGVARADTGLHAGDDLQRFVTRPDLMPPKWNITYHDRSRIAPGYWFIAPYRFADNHRDDVKWIPCEVGPMIFDQDGELVWSGACMFENRISFDFDLKKLPGREGRFLGGNLKHANFPEHDCGAGWFLNSKYEIEHSMLLAKDIDNLNQHEFNVEDHGKRTMIITHGREHMDAKALGREGKVWVRTDGFRDLDTETGEVLFDWKTDEHISLNESSYTSPADEDGPDPGSFSRSGAWDAYHANSATKNSEGDYLISIRHTDTLALVSGQDGHVIWRLGGKLSNFTFAPNAKFSRQHDARYLEHTSDRSVISLMDNAIGDMANDKQPATHDYSRGLILELSHKAGEPFVAKKVKEYARPDGGYGDRRGNTQLLPNGNVFMAWTDAGYISEHTDDDEVLMEAKWEKVERFGTYRGYKYDGWVGRPGTKPDVKALGFGYGSEDGGEGSTVAVYISWNGATEVRRWRILVNGERAGEVEKTGFETVFAATSISGPVQVEALDSSGKRLARSDKVPIEWQTVTDASSGGESKEGVVDEVTSTVTLHPLAVLIVFLLSLVATLAGFWMLRVLARMFRGKRGRGAGAAAGYKEIPLEEPILAQG